MPKTAAFASATREFPNVFDCRVRENGLLGHAPSEGEGGWDELAATSVGNRRATNHCRPGLGGFLRGRPMYAGGARSMVDHRLATPAAVPGSGADARPRRDNDSRRRAWAR